MNFNPNITIAIPVFERFDFFEDCLLSAINQTVKCNVVVVDNCSSHDLFEKYVASLGLSYVSYYRNVVNLGALGNWNMCITQSKTKWTTILHSDDMLSKHYIEVLSQSILRKEEAICFMSKYESASQPKEILKSDVNPLVRFLKIKKGFFVFGNPTAFPGVAFNREILQEYKFNEQLQTVSDYDFWLRIAAIQPIVLINLKLAFYRVSQGQDSAVAYRTVIKQSYAYKMKNIVKGNTFREIIAMYELFYTYRYYKQKFDISDTGSDSFEEIDIKKYFSFFERLPFPKFWDFLFKFYRKSYLYLTSLF